MYIECLWLLWVIAHCSFTEMTLLYIVIHWQYLFVLPSPVQICWLLTFWSSLSTTGLKLSSFLYTSNVTVWNVIYDIPVFLEIWKDVSFVINSLWVCLNVCLWSCLRWKHILEEWYFSCLVDIGLSWASNRHLSAINWQINYILGNAWSRCLVRLTPKPAENDGDALFLSQLLLLLSSSSWL